MSSPGGRHALGRERLKTGIEPPFLRRCLQRKGAVSARLLQPTFSSLSKETDRTPSAGDRMPSAGSPEKGRRAKAIQAQVLVYAAAPHTHTTYTHTHMYVCVCIYSVCVYIYNICIQGSSTRIRSSSSSRAARHLDDEHEREIKAKSKHRPTPISALRPECAGFDFVLFYFHLVLLFDPSVRTLRSAHPSSCR